LPGSRIGSVAAFSVLLHHWRETFFVEYHQVARHNPVSAAFYLVTGLGHQWVIIFFVLIGYLVGGSVLRSVQCHQWSWRAYLLARLTRLYIVLLPALLLGGLADWAGMRLPGAGPIYANHFAAHPEFIDIHTSLTLPALFANALFLQTIALPGMHGHTVPVFGTNTALWSLSNEFWYYIAFPLLVLFFAKPRSLRLRIACALGLVLWGWFVSLPIALLAVTWLMGTVIAWLPPFPYRTRRPRRLAIAAALVLLAACLVLGFTWPIVATDYLLGLAVTFLIWVTLHCAVEPLPTVYVRVAQRLARSSYTLYLVHIPLLIFIRALLDLPRTEPAGHPLLIGIAVLVAVFLFAQLIYELFEKNTDRVRNWIKPYVIPAAPRLPAATI
jgi:peptidoglycan/LPS O-acetylase OafA/YrhL